MCRARVCLCLSVPVSASVFACLCGRVSVCLHFQFFVELHHCHVSGVSCVHSLTLPPIPPLPSPPSSIPFSHTVALVSHYLMRSVRECAMLLIYMCVYMYIYIYTYPFLAHSGAGKSLLDAFSWAVIQRVHAAHPPVSSRSSTQCKLCPTIMRRRGPVCA